MRHANRPGDSSRRVALHLQLIRHLLRLPRSVHFPAGPRVITSPNASTALLLEICPSCTVPTRSRTMLIHHGEAVSLVESRAEQVGMEYDDEGHKKLLWLGKTNTPTLEESLADEMLLNLEVVVDRVADAGGCVHNVDTKDEGKRTIGKYSNPMKLPITPPNSPAKRDPTMAANRYTDAQRGRTLRHHGLVQPTPSQERAHLAKLRGEAHFSSSNFPSRQPSNLSLLTLPEDEREEVFQLDMKQINSCEIAGKSSTLSTTDTVSTFTSLSTHDGDAPQGISSATMASPPRDGCDQVEVLPSASLSSLAFDAAPCEVFCQPCEMEPSSPSHRFVVTADTQFGITRNNEDWKEEMEYSILAVDKINAMTPRPAFVCVCGDLVDMEFSFERKKGSKSKFPSPLFNSSSGIASREVCDSIQDEQNEDFKRIWSRLDPDIALVCLCGNHDVGNRPTPRSIARFRAAFGDEYLAFWANGSYNIVLNNVLFVDPSGAQRIFNTQLRWLENRLEYARDHQAKNVFVFAHHPWFLYDEEEDPESLTGFSPYPEEWLPLDEDGKPLPTNESFPDSYFSMPREYRAQALELFQQYGVTACFSGHFHQNLVSKTRWGMDMIVTAPLSLVFESTGKAQIMMKDALNRLMKEEHQDFIEYHRSLRRRKMSYESEDAMLSSSSSSCSCGACSGCSAEIEQESVQEQNCRGVRVVDVAACGGFQHSFVPL